MKALSELGATEFENLTFDLLRMIGFRRLVWRTPGADGGRDIEGIFPAGDASGYVDEQLWYVECKRYASSIDWPTVWQKIAHADALGADFLLLVTNSNPSPACETSISEWNSRRGKLKVRVWRGYELDVTLLSYPVVAAKYGLNSSALTDAIAVLPITNELTKIVQSVYVAQSLGAETGAGIEAAAAISELMSCRAAEFRDYGRFAPVMENALPDYDWLFVTGAVATWDEPGLRSLLALFRYITAAVQINVRFANDSALVEAVKPRGPISTSATQSLIQLSAWTGIEIREIQSAECRLIIASRSNT